MSKFNVVEFADVKERYAQKVALCESVDPYTISMDDFMKVEDLPKVTLWDIWNYFMTTKSTYSQDELLAKKGLSADKFFESGFVRKIVAKRLLHDKTIVVGLVEHSQRINEEPLHPWALCLSAGMILAAHCNCLAGLGEACSHVGSILYAVETLVRSYENESKTDFPCQWNRPKISTIERFLPLAEMCLAKKERIPQQSQHLNEFGKQEIFEWLQENKEKANVIAPLTLVTPGLNQEFAKEQTSRKKQNVPMSPTINENCGITNDYSSMNDYDSIILQTLITTIFKAEYQGKELQELLEISKTITVQMSGKYIELTEKLTKKQSDSWLWEKQRVGRVTGSTIKAACRNVVFLLHKHDKEKIWNRSH